MTPDAFVSEPIDMPSDFDTRAMEAGAPGVPRTFRWRGVDYTVTRVLRQWKDTRPCRHGSNERYVRRHWCRVTINGGQEMTLYFERHPRRGGSSRRWWLYTTGAPTTLPPTT